jgi:hypothetical protein
MRRHGAPILVAVMLAACVSVGSVRNAAPEAGDYRTFDARAAEVLEITRDLLAATDWDTREDRQENDSTRYILATQRAVSTTGLKRIVRVRIVGASPNTTLVRVYSKTVRSNKLNPTKFSSEGLFRRIETELQRRKDRNPMQQVGRDARSRA